MADIRLTSVTVVGALAIDQRGRKVKPSQKIIRSHHINITTRLRRRVRSLLGRISEVTLYKFTCRRIGI